MTKSHSDEAASQSMAVVEPSSEARILSWLALFPAVVGTAVGVWLVVSSILFGIALLVLGVIYSSMWYRGITARGSVSGTEVLARNMWSTHRIDGLLVVGVRVIARRTMMWKFGMDSNFFKKDVNVLIVSTTEGREFEVEAARRRSRSREDPTVVRFLDALERAARFDAS